MTTKQAVLPSCGCDGWRSQSRRSPVSAAPGRWQKRSPVGVFVRGYRNAAMDRRCEQFGAADQHQLYAK